MEIRLEVDADSDPISGRLVDGRGAAHEFFGWLQFIAAVDAARARRVA